MADTAGAGQGPRTSEESGVGAPDGSADTAGAGQGPRTSEESGVGAPDGSADPVVRLAGVDVVRNDRAIVDGVDWTIRAGERWVVLGPNGSGKTTLLQVVGARLWPTRGVVDILGHRLGKVDVRTLRPRIALVSGSVIRQLRGDLTAREVVATGRYGALEPWWDRYTDDDWARADQLLADIGGGDDDHDGHRADGDHDGHGADSGHGEGGGGDTGGGIGSRRFGVISEGERQRVLLARALMSDPDLLLLDEPAAGLDLGARERLVTRLARLCADPTVPPLVMVTHHAEEIPPGITHAALVRDGRLVAAGSLGGTLTSDAVSACFGISVTVGRDGGRWWSRANG